MNVTPLIMWLCLQRGYVSDVSWELLAYHTLFRSSADLKTIQMHLMFGRQWWNQFSEVHALAKITEYRQVTGSQSSTYIRIYEGWNFNFGNAAVTFDTAYLQSSYFHRPSMYSPKLCRTRSQRWGSRMMPLAARFVDGPDGAVYSWRLEPTLQLSYTVMLPYRNPLPVLGNSFAVLPLPASVLTKNAALV